MYARDNLLQHGIALTAGATVTQRANLQVQRHNALHTIMFTSAAGPVMSAFPEHQNIVLKITAVAQAQWPKAQQHSLYLSQYDSRCQQHAHSLCRVTPARPATAS